jgi:hypothetical protein
MVARHIAKGGLLEEINTIKQITELKALFPMTITY